LVIWPETAIPSAITDSALGATLRESVLRDWSGNASPRRIDVPLLLGLVVRTGAPTSEQGLEPKPSFALTNSAILSDSAGRVTGRYDKRELVPIGERSVVASSLPLLGKFFAPVNEFSPGEIRRPMTIGNHRLGVSICYEDIQHRGIRDSVKRVRPDLLVNLTSDAWFAGSLAPSMHLALATLRAVEHRRYLVRATTTGVTSVTDPTGRVVYRLPENTPVAGVAVARWLSPATIYESFGDWPWVVLTTTAFVFFVLRLGGVAHTSPPDPRDRRSLRSYPTAVTAVPPPAAPDATITRAPG
jgi:apolipoprotein N-acyltransferase